MLFRGILIQDGKIYSLPFLLYLILFTAILMTDQAAEGFIEMYKVDSSSCISTPLSRLMFDLIFFGIGSTALFLVSAQHILVTRSSEGWIKRYLVGPDLSNWRVSRLVEEQLDLEISGKKNVSEYADTILIWTFFFLLFPTIMSGGSYIHAQNFSLCQENISKEWPFLVVISVVPSSIASYFVIRWFLWRFSPITVRLELAIKSEFLAQSWERVTIGLYSFSRTVSHYFVKLNEYLTFYLTERYFKEISILESDFISNKFSKEKFKPGEILISQNRDILQETRGLNFILRELAIQEPEPDNEASMLDLVQLLREPHIHELWDYISNSLASGYSLGMRVVNALLAVAALVNVGWIIVLLSSLFKEEPFHTILGSLMLLFLFIMLFALPSYLTLKPHARKSLIDIVVLFTINFFFGIALVVQMWVYYFLLVALLLGDTAVVVYLWLLTRYP